MVFRDFKRHDAGPANQVGRLLNYGLDILRIIVLTADYDHIFHAPADVKLAVVEKADVPGPEIAFFVLIPSDDAGVKRLLREFGLIPIPLTFTLSAKPYLPDVTVFENDMFLRIDDLYGNIT